MAYDEDHAELLRADLFDEPGITEKKMFGGLCFMKNGNMVCGVHQGGGMARVGKEAEPKALEIEGVSPLSFTGRPMGGMVDVSPHTFDDVALRGQIIALALDYARSLPPKVAKPKKPR
jgi:TfoX/Sxy family transcriptional regulator of competence genes